MTDEERAKEIAHHIVRLVKNEDGSMIAPLCTGIALNIGGEFRGEWSSAHGAFPKLQVQEMRTAITASIASALQCARADEQETVRRETVGLALAEVKYIRDQYPTDVFGEGTASDASIDSKSARMARITCDNIERRIRAAFPEQPEQLDIVAMMHEPDAPRRFMERVYAEYEAKKADEQPAAKPEPRDIGKEVTPAFNSLVNALDQHTNAQSRLNAAAVELARMFEGDPNANIILAAARELGLGGAT